MSNFLDKWILTCALIALTAAIGYDVFFAPPKKLVIEASSEGAQALEDLRATAKILSEQCEALRRE